MSAAKALFAVLSILLLSTIPGVGGSMAQATGMEAPAGHHPRRPHRHRPADPTAQPAEDGRPQGPARDGSEFGGVDQFGYPDTDPERPYGANNTVTAPLGSAAAQEQENNRRYFCMAVPEHC